MAYDSVVFGFSGEKLKILLMEYHKTDGLPFRVDLSETMNYWIMRYSAD